MEEVVCNYSKFGFCKYKSLCKRKHFCQVCGDLSSCKDIKNCQMIHPNTCKRFANRKFCKCDQECTYFHKDNTKQNEDERQAKINLWEKIVTEMAHKLISLETELKDIKREKEIEDNSDKEEVTKPNIGDNKGDINTNEVVTEEIKVTKDTGDSDRNDEKGDFLQCNFCGFKCIKDSLLKKHIKAKHE